MPVATQRSLATQPYGLSHALSTVHFPTPRASRALLFVLPGALALCCLYVLLTWGGMLRTHAVVALTTPVTTIVAPNAGYLVEVHARDGQHVTVGQPLFTFRGASWQQAEARVTHLDTQLLALGQRRELIQSQLHQELQHLEAAREKQMALSRAATAAIEKQQKTLVDMETLSRRYEQAQPNVISQAQSLDLERSAADVTQNILMLGREQAGPQEQRMYQARRETIIARAQLALSEIKGQSANLALEKNVLMSEAQTMVVSPVAGDVNVIHLDDRTLLAGARVLSVVPVDQTPMLLVSLSPNDLNRIDRTAPATVEADSSAEGITRYRAKIISVSSAPDQPDEAGEYQVQLTLDDSLKMPLLTGMKLRVSFSLHPRYFWSRW